MTDTPAVALPDMPLAGLRQYRESLSGEEDAVSYWRRVLHGRVDLLTKLADRDVGAHPGWLVGIDELASALKDTATGYSRLALMRMGPPSRLPKLPGLDEVWSQDVDPSDPKAVADLLNALGEAAGRVDEYRTQIHKRLDAANAELVARYQNDPEACLDLID